MKACNQAFSQALRTMISIKKPACDQLAMKGTHEHFHITLLKLDEDIHVYSTIIRL